MKKLVVFLLVGFMAGAVFAGIVSTNGEAKIAAIVKSISTLCARAETSLTEKYLEAKNYVTAYPSQFETADKTKLAGLEVKINTTKTALNELVAYVNTEFPGLNE